MNGYGLSHESLYRVAARALGEVWSIWTQGDQEYGMFKGSVELK